MSVREPINFIGSRPLIFMIIYKQYDQAALNRQYNSRLHVPDFAIHLDRWEQWSRQAERKHTVIKNIPYGKLDRELLDIYPSAGASSKVLVFIHGGYWHKMDKSAFHFIADAFHDYNITTVLITYPLAPEVSIEQIISSSRQAMHWIYKNCERFNGNAAEIYVAGYSAGGHLAAMLLAANWQEYDRSLSEEPVKAVCTISGLFNLDPIRLSDINEMVKLNAESTYRNSPVKLKPHTKCPLLIAAGEDETTEFRAQSEELFLQWKDQLPAQLLILPGLNHFSVMEAFANRNSILHQRFCAICGLS